MESTRPIRALIRGLDALTVLNSRDGATVSEVAQEIRLPRTTVYRILETLCDSGFAFRDPADERYRLTLMVRGLSDGFDDEQWISLIAMPCIEELSREIVWPVSLATLSGGNMIIRAATDHASPLAVERSSAGVRLPLLTTAPGRAYLAYCPDAERDRLLHTLEPAQLAELETALADIKATGYAAANRTKRLVDEVSLSVPVSRDNEILAVLTVRFLSSAVSLKLGLERFLPKLRQCAAKIRSSFTEQSAQAHAASAPDAAV